jgi:SWI/SNF-related matrix-associated actin-dependent regulator of chromatin subfamily A3
MLTIYRIPFVRFDGSMSAKKRKLVLDAFSEPLTRDDDADEDQTEPESGDDGYEEYWDKRNGKGKAKAKAVSRLLERGKAQNPVVMLISLKVRWFACPHKL